MTPATARPRRRRLASLGSRAGGILAVGSDPAEGASARSVASKSMRAARAALRGLLVGAGTYALAVPLVGLPAERPLMLLAAGAATSVAFASLGLVTGVLATRIDHIFFLSNIVVQPLVFLGGVFYSAEMLPGPLRAATYLDPVFYAVDVFRYAAGGVSDAPPYPALTALVVFAALAFLGTVELIRRGYKLRY